MTLYYQHDFYHGYLSDSDNFLALNKIETNHNKCGDQRHKNNFFYKFNMKNNIKK